MPRAFAKVNVAIWQDPDFRALPPAAQHLYLVLWTAPNLTFCGVHDWRPGRLSHLSHGFTEEHTTAVGDCLAARHFFVIDTETEEVLIRAWARFDELVKQPRLAVSYATAYSATYSESLRGVLVYEAHKMQKLWPELPCWEDSRVSSILDHPSVSAKDLPVPSDPFGDGFGESLALGLGQTQGKVWGSVWAPPTTAVAVTTSNVQTESADKPRKARKRATSLPDDFEPSQGNRKNAKDRGVDLDAVLEQFGDWHAAKGSTFVNWHAALNTWIRREKPATAQAARPSLPHVSELDQ